MSLRFKHEKKQNDDDHLDASRKIGLVGLYLVAERKCGDLVAREVPALTEFEERWVVIEVSLSKNDKQRKGDVATWESLLREQRPDC